MNLPNIYSFIYTTTIFFNTTRNESTVIALVAFQSTMYFQPKLAAGYDSSIEQIFPLVEVCDGFDNRRVAAALLLRYAYIVCPLMQRRGWAVPVLREINPITHPNILGSNVTTMAPYGAIYPGVKMVKKGEVPEELRLRVRGFNDVQHFLPMNSIVQTMIHELAHYQYGAHSLRFYVYNANLLYELFWDISHGSLKTLVNEDEIPTCVAKSGEIVRMVLKDHMRPLTAVVKMVCKGKRF